MNLLTSSGKRIEFMITSVGADESDVHELSNELNARLPSSNTSQQPFTLPKPWHPAVDLTHRDPPNRQRTGSDHQPLSNNYNLNFQQGLPIQTDLARSTPYGGVNQPAYQQQFAPVFAEPIIDWSAVRQQDPHGQIDPQFIQPIHHSKTSGWELSNFRSISSRTSRTSTSANFHPISIPNQSTDILSTNHGSISLSRTTTTWRSHSFE